MPLTHEELRDNRVRGDFRVIRVTQAVWQVAYRNFQTGFMFPVASELTAEEAQRVKDDLNQTLFGHFPRNDHSR